MTTMKAIHTLTGLALEGEAGALVAEAVAVLAEGLPRRGGLCMEGPDRTGAICIPDVPAMTDTRGPAQRRLEALTGWVVTPQVDCDELMWVGPNCLRRWANFSTTTTLVTLWIGGGDRSPEGWHLRNVDGDPIEAACAELLRRHDEGIDPLPALVLEPAAPPLGVWLGRPPTEEERKAHALAHNSAPDDPHPLGWWAIIGPGVAVAMEYEGNGTLDEDRDAAPARDEGHALALIAARRDAKHAPPTFDPRIGQWCHDDDGEGLVVAWDGTGHWLSAIAEDGEAGILRADIASITTPPDPIPEPCRPAWLAFRALEGRE